MKIKIAWNDNEQYLVLLHRGRQRKQKKNKQRWWKVEGDGCVSDDVSPFPAQICMERAYKKKKNFTLRTTGWKWIKLTAQSAAFGAGEKDSNKKET